MGSMFSVLIIAEGEPRRLELSQMVRGLGCAPLCFRARQVTPMMVRDLRAQLILLEVSLPDGDGLVVLDFLETRQQLRKIPLVVVSAHPEMEYDLPDVLDFLPLPVNQERLRGAIKRVKESTEMLFTPPTPVELAPIKDHLLEHSGLHFSPRNLRLLERGLQRRMQALLINDYREYFTYLEKYHEARDELNKLVGMLTVGETSFFRYRAHKEALATHVLPELIRERQAEKRLRIWSAGCSTGEEPYSLAMLMLEKFPGLLDWDIKILATDINKRSLRRAREGVYRPHALRYLRDDYRQRYFRQFEQHYLVKPLVRQWVEFDYLNLQSNTYPAEGNGTANLDLILCRNVMIYFNLETMRSIIARFRQCLKPDGYLFLGHSETLQNVSEEFQRHQCHGAYFYRPKVDKPVEQSPAPSPPPAKPVVAEVPVEPEPSFDFNETLARALQAFDGEDFPESERLFKEILAERQDSVLAMVGLGMICVNRGEFDSARSWCARAIGCDDLCPDAYLLRGVILDAEEQLERAVVEFQKVLWLDSGFVVAHYLLSKVHLRLGKDDQARRSLRNALIQLEKSDEENTIPWSGGISRSVFMEICRRDMEEQAGVSTR
ncbi:MAG: histidine kinase [Desulfuromonas sp.]|nr:MAG: histidine kinase [Desulfuromonas sp.]